MLYRCLVVCVLSISFCLSGCSLMSRHYGATYDSSPDFNLDASQVPDAVPRNELKPRFCNPSSYTVKGRTYHVLRSSKSYCERGTASWYGTRFYKGKTSSGEPYNMLAMTAAHRSLPIPSYVRVTNLKNCRQIIVKINDRGPFKPGRIIDLSYVAAKKLGITKSGVGYVEVTSVDPCETSPLPSMVKKKSTHLAHKKVKKSSKSKHALKHPVVKKAKSKKRVKIHS